MRRVAPKMNEQRSRSFLCERVIRREATETEGLVLIDSLVSFFPIFQMRFSSLFYSWLYLIVKLKYSLPYMLYIGVLGIQACRITYIC